MPLSFHCRVHRVQSDSDQEITVVLKVPRSDYDHASPLGKMTEHVLIATIFTEEEVRREGGSHEDA